MADNLDLLFRIRGDASGAKNAVEQTRQAIKSLKDRIREVRSETDVGFKTERLQALNTRLTELNKTHQAAKDAAKQSTEAHKDFESALGTLSPRLGNVAGAVTGVVGPLALLAGSLVISTGIVKELATQLFGLAKSSADFQGKLHDLSQQTGVAVETLSALEIVAATTGGNIESIAQSLVVFQGKLDDAQDSTSKAGEKFKELGVSTRDTETAFREALESLAKMPEGFRQTNAAAELFGRRGGKQILAILKETQGDLDGAIRKFREMGILINSVDAKAADEFNDQLALLNFQLRALGAAIGKEVIPQILSAIKDLSKALKDNQDAFVFLTGAAKGMVALFTGPLTTAIGIATAAWEEAKPVLVLIAETYERIARAIEFILGKPFPPPAKGGASGSLGDEPEFGLDASLNLPGRKTTDQQKRLKESDDRLAKELELHRKHTEDLRFEHDRRTLEISEFYQKQNALVDERFNALNAQAQRERQIAQEMFNRGILDLEAYEDRKRDIDLQATKAENERDEAKRRLKLEKDRAAIAEEVRMRERLAEFEDVRRAGELKRLEAALARSAELESNVITRRLEFLQQSHVERLGIINFELKAEGVSAERKEELNQRKKISEQQYTDEFKRLTRERIDALNEEAAARGPGSEGIGEPDFAGIGARIEAEIGPPPMETFDLWKDAFTELKNIGANAMADLAFGVGSLIENWVLLGETGPKAMRKLVASVLAGVAAQAAVKAIYELAEGFAALFVNPAAAAAHFTSAAIFGSIAGVAAIAGRAVAGDAFQRDGRHGDGSGAGGDRGQLSPLTLQRNGGGQQFAPQIQPLKDRLDIRISVDDGRFGKAVQATIIDDINNRGPVGEIIAGDGNFNRG